MQIKNYLKKIIPKSIKRKIKTKIQLNRFYKYEKTCNKEKKKKYIMFITPDHGNLGDQAIVLAEKKFLKDNNISFVEIIDNTVMDVIDEIRKHINNDDIILITGGGYMGSQWFGEEIRVRKIIDTFPNNKIIMLPQTIFYGQDEEAQKQFELSKEIYGKHKKLYIFAREKQTYNLVKEAYLKSKVYLVPDMVLYNEDELSKDDREGITFIIRNDSEKRTTNTEINQIMEQAKKLTKNIKITNTVIPQKVAPYKRKKIVKSKLDELKKSKLVITDRLHGMIFSKITSTPCIAINNHTNKVKGVYEWLKDLPYIHYSNTVNDVIENMEEFYKNGTNKYKKKSFKDDFKELVKVIK